MENAQSKNGTLVGKNRIHGVKKDPRHKKRKGHKNTMGRQQPLNKRQLRGKLSIPGGLAGGKKRSVF